MKPRLQDIAREFTLAAEGDGWLLREVHSDKGAHTRREQPGMPTSSEFTVKNPFAAQPVGFIVRCTGKEAAEEIVLEVDGREVDLGSSLQPGEALRWLGGPEMIRHGAAWQELERRAVTADELLVPTGESTVRVTCRFAGADTPELKVEFRTIGEAVRLRASR